MSDEEVNNGYFSITIHRCLKRLKGYYGGPNKIPKDIKQIVNELPSIAKKLDELKSHHQFYYIINPFDHYINQLNNLTTHPVRKGTNNHATINYEKEIFAILKEIEYNKYTFSVYFNDTSRTVPRKPVNKHFHYPDSQIGHFVNRNSIFQKIHQTFNRKSPTPIAVLIGSGGSGKTQLAINYCRECNQNGSFSSIFWVDASSPTTTNEGFSKIAQLIDPTVDYKDSQSCIDTVKCGLTKWTDRWLIIFDHFDNPELFESIKISNYFPMGQNGAILFTSLRRDVNYLGQPNYVDKLSDLEAMELFFHRSDLDRNESNFHFAKEIIQKFNFLPFAIDLAAVYISLKSIKQVQFLEEYNKINQTLLTDYPAVIEYSKKYNDNGTSLTIFSLWELIFNHLTINNKEQIKKLLLISTFLDNRYISEEIFKIYFNSKSPKWMKCFSDDNNKWSSIKYQQALSKLSSSSLILDFQITQAGTKFSIHPLIQDWLRIGFSQEIHLEIAKEATILIAEYINHQDFDTLPWKNKEILLLHVNKCLESEVTDLDDDSNDNEILSLLNAFHSFATVYYNLEMFDEAEPLYLSALDGKQSVLGENEKSTLITIHKLSCIYASQGDLQKAETMCERALNGCLKLLGPDDPLTLEVSGDMGSVYQMQNKLDKAEELYNRSLTGCEKILPPDHKLIYEIIVKLAELYEAQGNLEKAESMIDRLLQNSDKAVAIDIKYTLNTANSIALAYKQQQKLNQAQNLYKKALLGFEKVYKPGHRDTLTTVYNLAVIYHDQRRLSDAEKMYIRAMNGFEQLVATSGKDAPVIDYLDTVNNLALVYYSKSQLDRVESLYTHSLQFLEQTLGFNNIHTLNSAYYLATSYHSQSKLNLAEPLYKRVLDGFIANNSTIKNNQYLTTIFNLGLIYEDHGKFADAETMFSMAKVEGEKILPPTNEYLKDVNDHLTGISKKNKTGKMKKQFFSVFAK